MGLKIYDHDTKSLRELREPVKEQIDIVFRASVQNPAINHARYTVVVGVLDRLLRKQYSQRTVHYGKSVARNRVSPVDYSFAYGYDPEVVRLALLSSHYRAEEMVWSDTLLHECRNKLDRYYNLLLKSIDYEDDPEADELFGSMIVQPFVSLLKNDLDTPEAIRDLDRIADIFEQSLNKGLCSVGPDRHALLEAGSYLGILRCDPRRWKFTSPGVARC